MKFVRLLIFCLGLNLHGLLHALPHCESISKVNINTASVKQLAHAFKGIGQQRAQAIVHYREAHGEFSSVAELAQVQNIGIHFIKHHLLELENVFTVISRESSA